jgi:hypothetical protein
MGQPALAALQVGAAQLAHLPPPGSQQPDGMDEHISLTELVTGGEVRPSRAQERPKMLRITVVTSFTTLGNTAKCVM